ncbi:diguanylate cyclase [Photobacterium sp. OFAV2-7]|uniref:diguanylate cyclase n=1 Tax=Photobacterium sp. OFAV2-7 TaxID=2917748 RepID=UPI001EF42BCB|nr:diguanylate cyclase [Photobacterium sp. OFAV2-7]MCG7585406.1 diguanylate cyclase [Photobacterium sp. OFAV2-7]
MSVSKILVVEDSRAFRNYLNVQLTQAGFEPVFAETIAQARQILTVQKDFLCTVLDYCLPDGQDGEIIDLVLSQNLKVIVLTAHFSTQIRDTVLSKGVIDYLLKDSPASVAYLIPLLQRLEANTQHKAMVVEDSATVRRYLVNLLRRQNLKVIEACHGQEAITQLERHPDISLIITDHDMPEKDGITMVREIRQHYSRNQLAILGLSGSNDDAMTALFLKAGANDFLKKPFNQEELYCRIHHILSMKDTADKLYRMANQDALTGLWNRRYFFNQSCSQDRCEFRNIAMLDIDFFKRVNDTYGHDAGDEVLVQVSQQLQQHFPDDIVARFGGEEFCIQSCSNFKLFISRLEALRQSIEGLDIIYQNSTLNVTISIGTVNGNQSLSDLLKDADGYLYRAKQSGRNQVQVAQSI